MPAPYSTSRRIEFRDTDAAGIAHFSTYFTMMEQAEHELLRWLDLSVLTADEQGVISWPRVSCQCDYQGPLRFEDVVEIHVFLERLGSKSITYRFEFVCREQTVAVGRTTAVCCRIEESAPPLAIEIPTAMREKLAPLVSA
jgi:4-hydroxybenzoyl-CoA thioesterase/acyl-CoA thioester hydrolase